MQILRLEAGVDRAAVKSAYRAMAKETHPDKGGDMSEFIKVKDAYDHLVKFGTGHTGAPPSPAAGWGQPFRVWVNVDFGMRYSVVTVTHTTA